jgi:membrane-associated phospholipid phosphatase
MQRKKMLALFNRIDIALFYLINKGGQNAIFDALMPIMSNVRNFFIPMGLFWIWMVTRKGVKPKVAALAIFAVIACSEWVSSGLLKPIFNRPRPYDSLSAVHLYDHMAKTWRVTPPLAKIIRGQSLSMPSSHATNIFAGACFLTLFFRRLWPVFYLIAFLVAYSRVYLGVHFPLDVTAGALVGTLCALTLWWPTGQIIDAIQTAWASRGRRG